MIASLAADLTRSKSYAFISILIWLTLHHLCSNAFELNSNANSKNKQQLDDDDDDDIEVESRFNYKFLANDLGSFYDTSIEQQLNSGVGFKCDRDSDCSQSSNTLCLNGDCVSVCTQRKRLPGCVYFHCDGKMVIDAANTAQDSQVEWLIETNNFPVLNRYLSNHKCSWILTNSNANESLIRLKLNRFSTRFGNDYLYVFQGDSVYNPLIGALR
jgi:hypothetical protein